MWTFTNYTYQQGILAKNINSTEVINNCSLNKLYLSPSKYTRMFCGVGENWAFMLFFVAFYVTHKLHKCFTSSFFMLFFLLLCLLITYYLRIMRFAQNGTSGTTLKQVFFVCLYDTSRIVFWTVYQTTSSFNSMICYFKTSITETYLNNRHGKGRSRLPK